MIQANELRIGNWYIIEVPFQWQYYHFEDYLMDDKIKDNINPIPLTPEILEKCGFVKEKGKIDIFTKGRLRIAFGLQVSLCYLVEEDTTTGHYIPIELWSLHQLQNLYFSLTGEELDIQL